MYGGCVTRVVPFVRHPIDSAGDIHMYCRTSFHSAKWIFKKAVISSRLLNNCLKRHAWFSAFSRERKHLVSWHLDCAVVSEKVRATFIPKKLTSLTLERRETLDLEEEQREDEEVLYHSALLRARRREEVSLHYGSKQGKIETLNHTLPHERGSERSERASERVSAAEEASKASSPEQANEWAVRANGWASGPVLQTVF